MKNKRERIFLDKLLTTTIRMIEEHISIEGEIEPEEINLEQKELRVIKGYKTTIRVYCSDSVKNYKWIEIDWKQRKIKIHYKEPENK